jgi:hypothetical protein
MYLSMIPMRPIGRPRPKIPLHLPDAGSGLILTSIVVLLMAGIGKKFGFFHRRERS